MNMIKVIRFIDTNFERRLEKIYDVIWERSQTLYTEVREDVIFEKLDVNQNLLLVKKYNVNTFPTTLFFKDDELVFEKKGIMATNHILLILQKI